MMRYIKGNRFDRDKGYMSDELFELFLGNADKYATAVVSTMPATPNASARLAQDSVRQLLRFARQLVKT